MVSLLLLPHIAPSLSEIKEFKMNMDKEQKKQKNFKQDKNSSGHIFLIIQVITSRPSK